MYGQSISVIDGYKNELIKTIKVNGYPDGVTVNPEDNRIYITDHSGGGLVYVIDGTSDKIIDQYQALNGPIGVAFNKNTKILYVANYGGVYKHFLQPILLLHLLRY